MNLSHLKQQFKHPNNAIFNNKKLCSKINGVIQIGACIGEEIPYWEELQIQNQIFIEPIPELFKNLEILANNQVHKPNVKCFNVAISDYDGIDDFHISTGSMCSSSLLDFDKDAIKYGLTMQTSNVIKVPVYTLDTLIEQSNIDMNNFNLLYIDVQGSEYSVIKGCQKNIKNFKYVFVEVNNIKMYENVVLYDEFDKYMKNLNFKLLDYRPLEGAQFTQSECLYVQS